MTRKVKTLGPEQYFPVEAVILAIDPAKKCSGYALLVPEYDDETQIFLNSYEVEVFGTVGESHQALRREVVENAATMADGMGCPPVIVAENWSAGGKRMTYSTYVGLGVGWGMWLAEIYACNIPAHCIVRPLPQQWKGRLLGHIAKGESKQTAQQYVQDVGLVSFPVGGDIADALCMGRWAAYSKEAWTITEKEIRRFSRKNGPDTYLEYEDDEDEDDDEDDDMSEARTLN